MICCNPASKIIILTAPAQELIGETVQLLILISSDRQHASDQLFVYEHVSELVYTCTHMSGLVQTSV